VRLERIYNTPNITGYTYTFVYHDDMSMTVTATEAGPEGARHLSVVRTEADVLASRLCELAGHIHAATAELVSLLGELERSGGWQGVGLRSIGHWASIELGIDARTASAQARAGLLLATVPEIARAARAGELGWDKLELLVRVVEPASESQWLALAREMSVGQLRRVVSAYRRDPATPAIRTATNTPGVGGACGSSTSPTASCG